MSETDEAGRGWTAMLARWAIPDHLVAAAPVSLYFFDPAVFIAAADAALARDRDSPSERRGTHCLPMERCSTSGWERERPVSAWLIRLGT